MAKQANNRKEPAKRTTTRRRTSKTDRSMYLGGALVVFLILLAAVGAASIFSSGDEKVAGEQKDKKTVMIPVPENKSNAVQAVVQAANNKKEDSDIAALVRLVLYDYEIARSSVEERTTKTQKGKMIYHFNVKVYPEMESELRNALMSVLKQKGYRVGASKKGSIGAQSENDEVNVSFVPEAQHDTNHETVKSSTKNNAKQPAAKNMARPTPPQPSNVVVKMAILLDDGGSNLNLVKRFVQLPFPVGIAVLPHLQYSAETAQLAYSYGKVVFLHFPMEPKSYPSTDPGEGAALVSMPELLIDGVAKYNFESLGVPVHGFNNHMGSAFTEDKVKMAQIMAIGAKYTNIFVDSRTTPNSVAYDECVNAGLKCATNKRFIDNDNDVNAIIEKIYEGAELAKKNGEVLLIGHVRKNTLDALEIALPLLNERRITIVPITSVAR